MKKLLQGTLALLVLTLVMLLPGMAGAEKVVDLTSEHYYCAPGRERVGFYNDYSARIGSGLTQDDFVITYTSDSEYITVLDETGRVMISSDAPNYNNLRLRITYTPKVEGVGVKSTFVVVLRTEPPIESFTANIDRLVASVRSGRHLLIIDGIGHHERHIAGISYDADVIELKPNYYYGRIMDYDIVPKNPGETEIVITSYLGDVIRIPVVIVGPVTQVEFGAESFSCHLSDTVDLGLDLGNGEYGLEAYRPTVEVTRDGLRLDSTGFFPENAGVFHAREAGHYLVKVSSGLTMSNTVMVHVYDRANCQRIELSTGELYEGRKDVQVLCYEAAGKEVILPLTITDGAESVSLSGRTLSVNGQGSVTITVSNEDGSSISRTYEIRPNPTEMFLNTEDLTLEIEETFDLVVSFDQGAYPHEYSISYAEASPAFGLHCLRIDGDRIIAQAPGMATITVKAGPFKESFSVTVPDSDKALHIVLPPEPFGVGKTFQMSVQDKTGKVYPAVFRKGAYSSDSLLLALDGTLTAGRNTGSMSFTATLEDGRVLSGDVTSKLVPEWISHPGVIASVKEGMISLNWVDSDVGELSIYHHMDFTIADTSIATRWNNASLSLHKPGVTTVTMWSKLNPEARCTFILEVLGEPELPVMYDYLDLPFGYGYPLPETVSNEKGKEVPVQWSITYESPGAGNPGSNGFLLEENTLVCIWPDASCVLTGIAKDTCEIKFYVTGYLLPSSISIEPAEMWLQVGDVRGLQVVFEEPGTKVRNVYWSPSEEGIVRLDYEITDNVENVIYAKQPGKVTLVAMLDNQVFATCDITVYEPKTGDADMNGAVNILDAMTILSYDSGEDEPISLQNADVSNDGQTDIQDALLLLQYSAGWGIDLN